MVEEARIRGAEVPAGEQGNFEEKTLRDIFGELDGVIEHMEQGDIPLEESFRLYHRGMDMLRACNEKIDRVEKQMLILDSEGEEHEFER